MTEREQLKADITAVKTAIRTLITTRQPVEISHDTETIKYGINELPQLQELLKYYQAELAALTPGGGVNFATFRRPR